MNKKHSHELFICKNANELLEELLKYDIDVVNTISSYIKKDAEVGILFTGSITDGNANGESDIDIKVLLHSNSDYKPNTSVINLEVENTKEVLIYKNGIEVNISFHPRASVEKTINSFLSIAPALYDPKDLETFPVIGKSSLQFLHDLKNGWIIGGENVVAIWRDECMVDLLPIYLTVHHFLISLELLEDTKSAIGQTKGACTFIGRMCLEHLFLSLLAKEKYTNQNRKWIFHNGSKFSSAESKQLFQQLSALFFSPLQLNKEEELDYYENIHNQITMVREHIAKDIAIGKAINYILKEINYVDMVI